MHFSLTAVFLLSIIFDASANPCNSSPFAEITSTSASIGAPSATSAANKYQEQSTEITSASATTYSPSPTSDSPADSKQSTETTSASASTDQTGNTAKSVDGGVLICNSDKNSWAQGDKAHFTDREHALAAAQGFYQFVRLVQGGDKIEVNQKYSLAFYDSQQGWLYVVIGPIEQDSKEKGNFPTLTENDFMDLTIGLIDNCDVSRKEELWKAGGQLQRDGVSIWIYKG